MKNWLTAFKCSAHVRLCCGQRRSSSSNNSSSSNSNTSNSNTSYISSV